MPMVKPYKNHTNVSQLSLEFSHLKYNKAIMKINKLTI